MEVDPGDTSISHEILPEDVVTKLLIASNHMGQLYEMYYSLPLNKDNVDEFEGRYEQAIKQKNVEWMRWVLDNNQGFMRSTNQEIDITNILINSDVLSDVYVNSTIVHDYENILDIVRNRFRFRDVAYLSSVSDKNQFSTSSISVNIVSGPIVVRSNCSAKSIDVPEYVPIFLSRLALSYALSKYHKKEGKDMNNQSLAEALVNEDVLGRVTVDAYDIYSKVITLVLAHEAFHIWFDNCEISTTSENTADLFARSILDSIHIWESGSYSEGLGLFLTIFGRPNCRYYLPNYYNATSIALSFSEDVSKMEDVELLLASKQGRIKNFYKNYDTYNVGWLIMHDDEIRDARYCQK